ncbi:hypothetical protein KJ980_03710 [Patescibacteria group bacterium]|nr:hypothetical protein [Patescibacteria group bacterium]MBU4016102.1 hypothetical protein [Patescibacteria group bacterium]MBU4098729.1 hypothetical protein [Patescibacteria group bacterium]
MIKLALIFLVIFWLLGLIHIPILSSILLPMLNHSFTLHNLLILIIIVWLINLLPGVFRKIVTIILVIWLLSVFGILSIAGLSNILIALLIIAIVFSFF